jgi:hypothetical protein
MMKIGRTPKMVIGGVGILMSLCIVLVILAAIFKKEPTPIPVMICLGIMCVLGPAMMLVGLSSMEKPWKAITGGLESVRRKIGSSKKTVKILNYIWALLSGGGAVIFVFMILPMLTSGRDLTPSQKSVTVIVVITFLIGFAFGGFYYWVDKDNPD